MLYADANYLGASQSLVAGSYDTAQLSIGNDTISSARVPTGCKLTLFQNGGYGGATQVLTKDWAGGLSDPWNDVTSSIRVEETAAIVSTTPVTCATGGAKLYHDSGFGGKTQTLSSGKYDTTNLKTVGNDAISSVRVASGCKVILYQNGAFSGATKVLTGDWSAPTGDPWNDITSSVEVKDFATAVAISPEMLVHGDFEQEGLNGTAWSATYPSANNGGSVTYGVQSKLGQAHDGTRYMEINSVPAGSSLYQRVATTAGKQLPGDIFRFTAWVRSPSCVAASAYFTLWSAPSNTNSYISITADCTWRQYSTIFTVTKTGETSLSPTLSINASGVNYDVDSASLVKVSYVE